jgi:hypothetical protein
LIWQVVADYEFGGVEKNSYSAPDVIAKSTKSFLIDFD